jgi:hypothetical protein
MKYNDLTSNENNKHETVSCRLISDNFHFEGIMVICHIEPVKGRDVCQYSQVITTFTTKL